jgi:hypothetical protein
VYILAGFGLVEFASEITSKTILVKAPKNKAITVFISGHEQTVLEILR